MHNSTYLYILYSGKLNGQGNQSKSIMTVTSEDCFIFDIVYCAQY